MGCASSSPLINGGGPGGIVETAKETASKTANDVLHAGETAIHDVGEHVKGAMKNVTNEIEGMLGGKAASKDSSDHINENDLPQMNGGHDQDSSDYKIIPLKDTKQSSVDESLENIKNNLMKKAQSFGDDTEKMADDIIKETEDLVRDAETGIEDHCNDLTTRITSTADGTIEILNLEEPEIERILDNDPKSPPTPEATINSLMSSSDGAATESEAVDSAATVVEQTHDESKREAIDAISMLENCSNSRDSIVHIDNNITDDGMQLPELTTEALKRVLSPETTLNDTKVSGDVPKNEEDDFNLSEPERRRQNFTLKLNSFELSVIEEKPDEDGSINLQSPEKEFVGGNMVESSEKSIEDCLLSLEGEDEARKDEEVSRTDSEGNEGLVDFGDDAVADEETETADNEDDSSERSLKGFEDVEKLLDRMPLVPTFKSLTKFRSFEYPRDEDDSDEEEMSHPFKKFCLKDFKSKMQSESNLDISEGDDGAEEEQDADDGDGDTVVPEDDFDMDAAIDEVLEETSLEVQQERWKMLRLILHKLPYRVNSYDLFGESDEDILENLFKQRKNKASGSTSEESARSLDSV